mmetsp:Transcript_10956/g.33607  ORF Transcript_10956/g.33607 Transcript_10956/m.33607 type:complete len:92 (+) Transcript_10956:118-393(+)
MTFKRHPKFLPFPRLYRRMQRSERPCQDEMMRFLSCLHDTGFSKDGRCMEQQKRLATCVAEASLLKKKRGKSTSISSDLERLYESRRKINP